MNELKIGQKWFVKLPKGSQLFRVEIVDIIGEVVSLSELDELSQFGLNISASPKFYLMVEVNFIQKCD